MALDKPMLLLVEDEALIAVALEQELADAGFEVLLVHDGQEAVSQIDQGVHRFSGLISDIRYPPACGRWLVYRKARPGVSPDDAGCVHER